MSKPLINEKKKNKHRRSVRSKHAKKGAPLSVGHEDRLQSYTKRTLQLSRLGYYHHEIASTIALEYELESVPAITTIADWLKRGREAVAQDIKELQELQWQMRIAQFTELEKLKAKWIPLAMAENLEITRWVRIEGELQPSLDEDAVKEQIEATKQVVSIMQRQARLLGLDIEKSITEAGEGPASLQELQIWLIGQVNLSTGAPNGQAIDIQSERLELRSGIKELDQDEI